VDDCFTLQGKFDWEWWQHISTIISKTHWKHQANFLRIIWACNVELWNTMICLFVRRFVNKIVISIKNHPHIEMWLETSTNIIILMGLFNPKEGIGMLVGASWRTFGKLKLCTFQTPLFTKPYWDNQIIIYNTRELNPFLGNAIIKNFGNKIVTPLGEVYKIIIPLGTIFGSFSSKMVLFTEHQFNLLDEELN